MEVYTIGFTQKTAAEFFGALRRAGVRRVVDVRLHNTSQLAGFAKRDDLAFFLRELCRADYVHEPLLAPTEALFKAYRARAITWEEYAQRFRDLMVQRAIEQRLARALFMGPTALLCSEATADRCHRRLVLEYLQIAWDDLHSVHL